jgi:hypothetical protein
MSNKLQIKRSAVAGKTPLISDIDLGELAVNTYDGKLFLKKNIEGIESVIEVGKVSEDLTVGSFGITIDGGGSPILPGIKGYITIPYSCTLKSWSLIADIPGSIVVDLWKNTYENYPPNQTDSITGLGKPFLTNSNKNQDPNLIGWIKAVAQGDILAFYVESASISTRIHLTISTLRV